jgi:hypothetical protein
MTADRWLLVSRGGARLLRGLPGWTLSVKGTSLYRRIARAHVSVYTKAGKPETFYAKIEVPLEAINEADAAGQAQELARRALT